MMEKDNSDILVSVVCFAYNHELYIKDALEGFVSQETSFRYQVIVHDDASTDKTADIIREYALKYPDIIKPIFQTINQHSINGGILTNYIFPKLKGKYVAICEGDDYWIDKRKLEKQFLFLESHPDYSLVVCSVKTYDCHTGRFDNRFVTKTDRIISMEDLLFEKDGRIFQTSGAFMPLNIYVDRKDWQKVFPYGDRPLWMRAALDGKIFMMKDVMSVYRFCSPGSWTLKVSDDKEFKTIICKKVISGMEAFDASTNCQFHDLVERSINSIYYSLAIINRDWKKIKQEFYSFYKKEKIMNRIIIKLRCKYYRFYRFIRKN